MDDFRSHPIWGEYRSEHEIFDYALEQSFEDTAFYQIPDTLQKSDVEVNILYEVRSLDPQLRAPTVAHVVAPAQADAPPVLLGAGEGPPFPPPPAPEPEILMEPENLIFPESNLQMTPALIHDDNSQRGVAAQ